MDWAAFLLGGAEGQDGGECDGTIFAGIIEVGCDICEGMGMFCCWIEVRRRFVLTVM